jgi:preprotein translocase subunit SecE
MAQTQKRRQTAAEDIEELDDIKVVDEVEDHGRGMTAAKGRVTPGRRTAEDEDEGGNFLTRLVRGLRHYFEGVRAELKKVAWPTREDTRRLTLIVIGMLIASSLVLGTIGLLFTELFRIGLNSPLVLLGFMVVVVVGGFIFYQTRSRRSNQ